jgi:hypothetical protein
LAWCVNLKVIGRGIMFSNNKETRKSENRKKLKKLKNLISGIVMIISGASADSKGINPQNFSQSKPTPPEPALVVTDNDPNQTQIPLVEQNDFNHPISIAEARELVKKKEINLPPVAFEYPTVENEFRGQLPLVLYSYNEKSGEITETRVNDNLTFILDPNGNHELIVSGFEQKILWIDGSGWCVEQEIRVNSVKVSWYLDTAFFTTQRTRLPMNTGTPPTIATLTYGNQRPGVDFVLGNWSRLYEETFGNADRSYAFNPETNSYFLPQSEDEALSGTKRLDTETIVTAMVFLGFTSLQHNTMPNMDQIKANYDRYFNTNEEMIVSINDGFWNLRKGVRVVFAPDQETVLGNGSRSPITQWGSRAFSLEQGQLTIIHGGEDMTAPTISQALISGIAEMLNERKVNESVLIQLEALGVQIDVHGQLWYLFTSIDTNGNFARLEGF